MRDAKSVLARSRMRGPHRAVVAAVLMTALLPSVALAAAPVAVDDPGIACQGTSPSGGTAFGGSYPIAEDYRAQQPNFIFPGDQAQWFPYWGHCSLLYNDTDADGDPLTYQIVTPPAHGQVMKLDDEWTVYKPDPDYSTRPGNVPGGDWVSDSFTYEACDASTCSAPATMRIWIEEINDAPSFTPGPSLVTVDEDSGPYSAPWATDISAGPPSEGYQSVHFERDGPAGYNGPSDLFTVLPSISPDGTLTFTPAPNASGHAHVTIVAKDDGGGPASNPSWKSDGSPTPPDDTSDQVTFEIDVTPSADPIVAADDSFTIDEDSGVHHLDLLANDSNPDGGSFWITGVTPPMLGTAAIETFGVAYTPKAGATGTDTFDYTLLGGSTATVTVHITPVDEPADTTSPTVAAPTATLPGQTVGASTTKAHVSWSATDAESGVASSVLQVSVDGGGYRSVALAKPTATSADVSLSTDRQYRFRVRATDKAGNVGAFEDGPPITPIRRSQEDSHVIYVGAWSLKKATGALNGSTRYATPSTHAATYSFTGSDVGLVATRYTTSGHAQVLVDGVLVRTVSVRRSATAYRQLVFARHFATAGPHTLQVRPVGDGRVDIDGFVVLK
jgi:hypothetical protein